MKIRNGVFCAFCVFLFSGALMADERGVPFSVGEKLVYSVYAAGFYLGKQTIEILSVEDYKGKEVYKIFGHTKSSPFITIFFRIDDKWTVYTDKETLMPVRMEKDMIEGKKKALFIYDIDQEGRSVVIRNVTKNKNKNVTAEYFVLDLFSLIYYYRKFPDRIDGLFTFDFLEERSLETVQCQKEGVVDIEMPKVIKNRKLSVVKLRQVGGVGIEIFISRDELRLPLKLLVPSKLSKKKRLLVEFYLNKYTPGVDQGEIPSLYKLLSL